MNIGDIQTVLRYASKWEVYRAFAYITDGDIKLTLTRNNLKWTERDQEHYSEFYVGLLKRRADGLFAYEEEWDASELPAEYLKYFLSDKWQIGDFYSRYEDLEVGF